MSDSVNTKPTVFVSYNWESKSNELVNKIQQETSDYIHLIRDKNAAEPWKSIEEFMQRIRTTDRALVVLSNKYLKSINCMYEISQLMKELDWEKKSMFVVMSSANKIYDAKKRLSYIDYWKKEAAALDRVLQKYGPSEGMSSREELNKIKGILLDIENIFIKVPRLLNAKESQAVEWLKKELGIKNDSNDSTEFVTSCRPKELESISELWEGYVPIHHVIEEVNLSAQNLDMRDMLFSFKSQIKSFEVKYDQKQFYLSEENREQIENFLDNLIAFAENTLQIHALTGTCRAIRANVGNIMLENTIRLQICQNKNNLLLADIHSDYQSFKDIMEKYHNVLS